MPTPGPGYCAISGGDGSYSVPSPRGNARTAKNLVNRGRRAGGSGKICARTRAFVRGARPKLGVERGQGSATSRKIAASTRGPFVRGARPKVAAGRGRNWRSSAVERPGGRGRAPPRRGTFVRGARPKLGVERGQARPARGRSPPRPGAFCPRGAAKTHPPGRGRNRRSSAVRLGQLEEDLHLDQGPFVREARPKLPPGRGRNWRSSAVRARPARGRAPPRPGSSRRPAVRPRGEVERGQGSPARGRAPP